MLSQKTRYTIRALMHLADKYQQGLVPLQDIAEAQNIPSKFLTVILSEMTLAGIVASQRGRDGGYELALAPVDISYGDIIRICCDITHKTLINLEFMYMKALEITQA